MSDTADGGTPPSPAGAPPLVMSSQQRAVLDALAEKDDRLGEMFFGALHALQQQGNPDRLPQAAHSLRELMEKLPQYMDVPAPQKPLNLKEAVQRLIQDWRKAKVGSTSATTDDGHGTAFLVRFETFAIWFDGIHVTRRERVAAAIRGLDGGGQPLPTPIESLRVREWQECDEFFQAISHHGKQCGEEELRQWQEVLERFLLDRLRPRTFDDFSVLDAIIEEGERDA